jgi:hypothetical protein
MHEIKALTDASIRLLDRIERLDHRSIFKSLYDFEGAFDTGFTRFRLMDFLLKRTRYAWQVWEPKSMITARCSEKSPNRK